ncbi:putative UPF0481 protein At3g02645 [Momordica charantia]|uniref:UPF0481 protein At3g02645 n=1 Tax=Momordica charantia TaxID=3673 RepID=A0A6J1DRR1_MOMCH|nr:putative UPF0481 protein At3g02645 [Momordica charantia]
MASILAGTLEKSQWVVKINELIDGKALDGASQTPISVFQLPASVHDGRPEAFLPRRVAVGPYHHFRPELYKMDLFKLGKAKNHKLGPQLRHLLDQIKPLELKIRASFDQPLEMDAETLSWVLLIDGIFLLEVLKIRYYRYFIPFPTKIFHGKLPAEFEIVCDILKLENQIPLFVLREICPEEPTNYLPHLMYKMCVAVSPVQIPFFSSQMAFHEEILNMSHHFLHFLYLLVLLTPEWTPATVTISSSSREERESGNYSAASYSYYFSSSFSSDSFTTECFNILGSVINVTFLQQLKETVNLVLRLIALLRSITKPNLGEKKIPRIPSASALKTAGVRFQSTRNGVLRSRFDRKTLTVALPCITLNGFSQVVLRNLVAYEAMAELNPPCLANYIAIMSGLVRGSKDFKILEKAEIIRSYLDSEREAVEIFNGVESCGRSLKKEGVLEYHLVSVKDSGIESEFVQEFEANYKEGFKDMVEEINKWYENCWRMKMKRFVSLVLCCFAILGVLLLIGVVIARFICSFSFVSCPKGIFKASIALYQTY